MNYPTRKLVDKFIAIIENAIHFAQIRHYTGRWERSKYVGVSLVGKIVAIIGFGKVGTEVARRAKGLGMHVIAHDPYAAADRARSIGVDLVPFEQAIATADFISLHMPLTPTTSKLFNDDTFSKMKKGVRIINVARGGVIDETALLSALESGVVAQVHIDIMAYYIYNNLLESLFSKTIGFAFYNNLLNYVC